MQKRIADNWVQLRNQRLGVRSILPSSSYEPTEAEVADWTGLSERARFQGAKQADMQNLHKSN